MSRSTLLVSDANGSTGFATVAALADRGFDVRALVHHDDERADRLRALGAGVVEGD
ncbi:NmrA family NAD(P)-binding protein [Subtercola endophyticus]|uniref:NmrA family NAD(P)-binding protein n=1 Tax=Subtercola endophyticus TaxID=2895559 RepID=UPI001E44FCFB|nr:NmrA family NAD(P)-binding protein [Subtercola endophyticus]UFS60597.1 NmrA family NAD(P)-binding protein [Subtercola endophyticus]